MSYLLQSVASLAIRIEIRSRSNRCNKILSLSDELKILSFFGKPRRSHYAHYIANQHVINLIAVSMLQQQLHNSFLLAIELTQKMKIKCLLFAHNYMCRWSNISNRLLVSLQRMSRHLGENHDSKSDLADIYHACDNANRSIVSQDFI